MRFTAHLADRVGARRLLWVALFAWSALLCVLPLTDDRWSFSLVLVPVMIAGGSIDTAMNAEASHRLVDHPSTLVRLHALFNTGALCGAAVAALLIHAGHFVAVGVAGDRRHRGGGGRVGADDGHGQGDDVGGVVGGGGSERPDGRRIRSVVCARTGC